jgi:hypothetical protein
MDKRRALAFVSLLLAGGAIHFAVGQAVTVPNLVGYWRFDETVSPSADSAGGANATWTGTPAAFAPVPAGPPGIGFTNPNSIDFDGATDYVDNGTFAWPAGGGPITIAFWNYALSPAQNSCAFTVGNQDQPNRCQVHAPWSDGNIYWDYGTATTGNGRVSTSYAGKLDKWTHVVLVSAGTGGTFQGIYLDGVLANSVATSGGPTAALTGVRIGHANPGGFHKGRIDDFRIYNRVLSASEVTTLHQGQLPGAFSVTATGSVGQVDLSWTASSSATDYTITRTPTGGGVTVNLGTQTGTTYSDTTGTAGTSYDYTVQASNIVGNTSATATATPAAAPPPPPRYNDHEEGVSDRDCGCGVLPPVPSGLLVLPLLALLAPALRRRRR